MLVGRVTGCVVSTVKDEGLWNIPLLPVRIQERGREGETLVAADATGQAGQGDLVYLIDGKEAAKIFRRGLVAADLSIVGFIDSYNRLLENEDKGEQQ